MWYSFYLFIFPIIFVSFYIVIKYFWHRKAILAMENNAFLEEGAIPNHIEDAREKIFVFFDSFSNSFFKSLIIFLHWLLHFFVLFLKFISNLTDVLYASARDFFLETATREKGVVSTFWHHLKEYKKEKEEEEQK